MKRIRRIILILAFITSVIAVILLLNFTAPNPTGRRYSSRMPLSTGQGNAGQIGLDGERVLADDLRLPRNDEPDQLQCICNSPGYTEPSNCRVCIVSVQMDAPYRRPDFVAPSFIAESKNAQNLFYESRDFGQIADYVLAAKALNRPLWVYTRVNTNLDAQFTQMVRSTGGDTVAYFAVSGYADPVDQAAKAGLGVSVATMVVVGLWERLPRRSVAGHRSSPPTKDKTSEAAAAVDHVDSFVKRSKDQHRDKLG